MKAKRFKLDLNLDDEGECRAFNTSHGEKNERRLARDLGLMGWGAYSLADALQRYANFRTLAFDLRVEGRIVQALGWEDSCNLIYRDEIAPLCECW